jgi:hypothetical protein
MSTYTFNSIHVCSRCFVRSQRVALNGFKRQYASLSYSPPVRSSFVRNFGTWPKVRPIRIRVITMDITGTLVSFRGSLKEHYVGSAEKCGVDLPEDIQITKAFSQAYKECSRCKLRENSRHKLKPMRRCCISCISHFFLGLSFFVKTFNS